MMKASGFTFQQSDCAALEKGLDPKFVDAYKKQAVAAEPNEETIVAAMMLVGMSDSMLCCGSCEVSCSSDC